ncbi:hypothetical protein AB0J63_26805 [Streptosporangium canum]|uniref:hypothetical protein n=1 Tax=Streptosporangium canum TaxID=324952 RepID=UPI0034274B1D
MTRLERLLRTLAVVLTQSPQGRHHGAAQAVTAAAEPVRDDAPTVAFSRLTSHPYPASQEPTS